MKVLVGTANRPSPARGPGDGAAVGFVRRVMDVRTAEGADLASEIVHP